MSKPPSDLSGKVALVTGAGSGIGRATCLRLAEAGAAVMCADVVAYSAMMAADEAATLEALTRLRRELWRPLVRDNGGRVVGSAGDSLLVEFPSVVAAVACALAIQTAMANSTDERCLHPGRGDRYQVPAQLACLSGAAPL